MAEAQFGLADAEVTGLLSAATTALPLTVNTLDEHAESVVRVICAYINGDISQNLVVNEAREVESPQREIVARLVRRLFTDLPRMGRSPRIIMARERRLRATFREIGQDHQALQVWLEVTRAIMMAMGMPQFGDDPARVCSEVLVALQPQGPSSEPVETPWHRDDITIRPPLAEIQFNEMYTGGNEPIVEPVQPEQSEPMDVTGVQVRPRRFGDQPPAPMPPQRPEPDRLQSEPLAVRRTNVTPVVTETRRVVLRADADDKPSDSWLRRRRQGQRVQPLPRNAPLPPILSRQEKDHATRDFALSRTPGSNSQIFMITDITVFAHPWYTSHSRCKIWNFQDLRAADLVDLLQKAQPTPWAAVVVCCGIADFEFGFNAAQIAASLIEAFRIAQLRFPTARLGFIPPPHATVRAVSPFHTNQLPELLTRLKNTLPYVRLFETGGMTLQDRHFEAYDAKQLVRQMIAWSIPDTLLPFPEVVLQQRERRERRQQDQPEPVQDLAGNRFGRGFCRY